MEPKHYTTERNVQIVIALLKKYGIRRVVASPGTTNMTFVASIQNDSFFEVYSSVDERSAAYIACGMASESGEPVVISCTGATASRNYMPGLTEAYYRKLPVLAVTSTRGKEKIGHLIDQQIDRRVLPNDIVNESVDIPFVKDAEDEHYCMIEVNKALLALQLNGGGPSHINLCTRYSLDFSVESLPDVNRIHRYTAFEELPELTGYERIAVLVGSHQPFTNKLTYTIERFCASHDAVVFVDHTSGYNGRYAVHFQTVCGQQYYHSKLSDIDLCIHIGEVSGDQFHISPKNVWRVSPDGALRDTFHCLRNVFMMPEDYFFDYYGADEYLGDKFLQESNEEINNVISDMPELPFSNIWIAQYVAAHLPKNADIHLGIYHSLRSLNFFKLDEGVSSRSNVGGFGIDGCISTLLGASLVTPNRLHFAILGDLAFFYDMNALGNRHVGKNLRILVINNGKGEEFMNYNHPCRSLGEQAEPYIAAAGHFGKQSKELVKHYTQDLGLKYLSAATKEEFLLSVESFLNPEPQDSSFVFEVFTDGNDESLALEKMLTMSISKINKLKLTLHDILK